MCGHLPKEVSRSWLLCGRIHTHEVFEHFPKLPSRGVMDILCSRWWWIKVPVIPCPDQHRPWLCDSLANRRHLGNVTCLFLSSSEVGKLYRFFTNYHYSQFCVFLFESPVHFLCSLWLCSLLICRCLKIDLYPLSQIANVLSRFVVLTLFKAFCFALLYKAFWVSGNQIYEAFS